MKSNKSIEHMILTNQLKNWYLEYGIDALIALNTTDTRKAAAELAIILAKLRKESSSNNDK